MLEFISVLTAIGSAVSCGFLVREVFEVEKEHDYTI